MQQGDGGGGQCGAVAYTPRTGETRTCQTSPVSGGDRSLISCMHTHASPPVPYPPIYTHPSPPTHHCTSTPPTLWFVLFVQLKLLLQRTYLQKCKQQWSKCSITYLRTYIHTDRQTERGAQCLHVSSHRLLVLGLLCLLHTHTHNEDHDTHQVGSMSSQHKATPLSHSHTKQPTEGGRVQLLQHHVQFFFTPSTPPSPLPSLFPPSSLPCIHPLPSLHSVHIPSQCHCWLVSWGTSVAQTCSVSPLPRPVEHWSKWQGKGGWMGGKGTYGSGGRGCIILYTMTLSSTSLVLHSCKG